MVRLTKRQSDGSVIAWHPLKYYNYNDFKKVLERLAYYEDLEEQEKLVVLPCKVNTRAYRIVPDLSVTWPDPPKYKVIWVNFKLDDIYSLGKDVFLTREEAEVALKTYKW